MNQHSTAASTQRFFSAPLAETDPELAAAIGAEFDRQQDGIELIASENIVSTAVLEDDLDDVADKMDDLVAGCAQNVPTKNTRQSGNTL